MKTTLFIRTRREMQLTTEGVALLRYCQASRELEGETLAKFKGLLSKAMWRFQYVLRPVLCMHALLLAVLKCLKTIRDC